ncbi:MAG: DUF4294 domain-containing protein [Bacteroidales bacterium]|nr:DUF4294 domain-containing protein [Bacteroidales bacterium]
MKTSARITVMFALATLLAGLPCAGAFAQSRDTIKKSLSEFERIQKDKKAIEERIKRREERMRKLEKEKARAGITTGTYYVLSIQVVDGDTIFLDRLPAIFKFARMKGNRNRQNWRQYRRLVYNFKKTYPYALQAREIIREADSVLAVSDFTEAERERYINDYQKRLFKQFEKPMRDLTISQGGLLLKLIDRELGRTSFYIIREYRGRISAGFWQTVARIFGNDLKKPYDKFGEDRQVEDLVMLYNMGAFDSLYYSMFTK